jgi:transposase
VLLLGVVINRRPYATDLSDARWALIEPFLPAWRAERVAAGPAITQPVHDLREIVNAILYVSRAGCAWQLLPHDFPPYQTVYRYYAAWQKDGTTAALHDLLRTKVRQRAVLVTAASVHDNAGGQALIRQLAAARQDVARVWVDAGYKRAVADEGAAHGMQVQVYSKPARLKGFHATPR